jgi:hypothetical protein
MNTSYSKRRHIQEANNRLEERMLNEQQVNVGDTVNLYTEPVENNSNFLTQATIKGFLDDVNIPETQYKRKTYPGRIEKVISITAPNYNDAILRFSCPSNINDSDFDLRWNSGPAQSNNQIVYNKNLSKSMIEQFCSTKPDPNNLLRKTSVPKATFSSTEPVSSSMAEGKKVKRVIKEDVSKEDILNKFGFQKQMEKTLDNGSTIAGYTSADPKYSIRLVIMDKDGVDHGKIIYHGPQFAFPDKKEEVDLTERILGKNWFPVLEGDMFPRALHQAFKLVKTIKDYHGAPSLR